MPVLTEPKVSLPKVAHEHAGEVAAVLKRTPKFLVAHLSGGASVYYGKTMTPSLPGTMLRPVTFDDTDATDELRPVALTRVDEGADDW